MNENTSNISILQCDISSRVDSLRSSIIATNGPIAVLNTIATASDQPKTSSESICIFYQNVRGLKSKISEVFLSTSEFSYDAYVFTETWLDDRIASRQLFSNDYNVFRVDRGAHNSLRKRGGGVLVAVAKSINAAPVHLSCGQAVENLWIKIAFHDKVIFLGVVYIPPNNSKDCDHIQLHLDTVVEIVNRSDCNEIILFGDFNQPRVEWSATTGGYLFADPLLSYFTPACRTLLDGLTFCRLRQRNAVRNSRDRILDLIYTSDSITSSSTAEEAPEPVVRLDPDHPALLLTIKGLPAVAHTNDVDASEYNFRKTNFDALNGLLCQMDWSDVYATVNVDDAVTAFNNKLRRCFSEVVPPFKPPKNPPWSNARLRYLKRQRSKMLKKYCLHKNQFSKCQFEEASRVYRCYNRLLYRRHLNLTESSLRRHPKRFWTFVNSKRKDYGLPTCMKLGDLTASTVDGKCELFASHFGNVFNSTAALHDPDISNAYSFRDGSCGSREVEVVIYCWAGRHPIVCAEKVFRCTSRTSASDFQSLTATSNISYNLEKLVFDAGIQKGDKTDIANYRGIISLSAGSKCLETILNKVIFEACKNYITSSQHGFFRKRSVESNLCEFTSFCISKMDAGVQIDAIYTDIKAAFDTVNHEILYAKLRRLGFSDRLCDWLKSYLANRQLYVKIRSAESTIFSPQCGVPQGSNLGPLLFALFFNDVSSIIPNSCVLIYADDLKIYLVVHKLDDCFLLQDMLDSFTRWCRLNHLVISIAKCCVISYRRLKNPILFNYSIDGTVLKRVDQIKDLGVLLDYQLSFKAHYSATVDKANRQLGFVSKVAVDFTDPLCLRALYCSLVRSILEFGSIVWSPYEELWISRIESVQRRFVRYALCNLPWTNPQDLPPYKHRCALIGIETLEDRRNANQAVFGAKILQGEIDSPALLGQIHIYAPQCILRPRQWLRQPPRNTVYGNNDPMLSVSGRFQEAYHLFDFNVSTNTFRQRIYKSM
ncbi:uncharacterized protein LOC128745791 [Sabethes cyaneus]|uniref:uncharacterized protein LOC128745791 n=1 Tax=Sabethes cyaneus TaxID=53552 RepID=UPI00237ECF60|nr:uncharacterized protein LOC128745791 [Sabethes cyaneus]